MCIRDRSDVEASARILQSVGCKVLLENGRAVITPPEFPGSAVPEPLMRAMRSSLSVSYTHLIHA